MQPASSNGANTHSESTLKSNSPTSKDQKTAVVQEP